ncbi:MAG: thiamine diphosphokinase [Pseudomonadota bacterium]
MSAAGAPEPRYEGPAPRRFDGPVLLLGGGPVSAETREALAPRCAGLVAADGGANRLRGGALKPDAIVGDLDSLEDRAGWEARGVPVIETVDQDFTDLEKSLAWIDAPLVLAAGFLGARFDHSLAALHALLRAPGRPVVLVGEEDVLFLAPRTWRARLAPGARVSIFPAAPVTGLRSEGLEWPLRSLAFEAGRRIGTSNRASAEAVTVEFDGPGAAIMLERRFWEAAAESLAPGTLR